MSDCFENLCAGGTLECGSEAAAMEFRPNGGSFVAALHQSAPLIFMVSGCPPADGHERLP